MEERQGRKKYGLKLKIIRLVLFCGNREYLETIVTLRATSTRSWLNQMMQLGLAIEIGGLFSLKCFNVSKPTLMSFLNFTGSQCGET